ncbi:MAG: Hint domain-containing protein, partial [Pseudomonadota bacterium]
EALTSDHKLLTQSGEYEKILVVLNRHVSSKELAQNEKLLPVKITKSSLAPGLPQRDLWVSRQHRFFVSSPICKRMFGQSDALVSAIQLVQLPGVFIDYDVDDVSYYHILLQKHEIVFAEGTPTESLFLGEYTLQSLSDAAREEVYTLFPDLVSQAATPTSAHLIPPTKLQKNLIARHRKNNKPLLV